MFNFRKIASVLASTVMLSSTLAFAAAANFPSPFVKGGMSDVAVVYGTAAANSDLLAVGDVTQYLATELAKQTTSSSGSTSSGTTVTGGDYVKLSKTADNINLGDVVTTVFGSTVSDDHLKELLKDGTYTNDENTEYPYEQKITLGSALNLQYFQDPDYKNRQSAVGFNISSNAVILNYTLDFTTDAESDVSGGDLVDLETTTIKMLGKEYYISDVDNSTLEFVLLDTANSAVVAESETNTISVGEKSYDVKIEYISTTEVKLNVNGEVTNSLAEGGTYKLKDGSYVGIKDILARDIAGAIGKVEYSIGSGKLELKNGQSIEINDKSVSQIITEISRGSSSAGKEKINRINLVWQTDDDAFITPETELVMPGFKNIKFSMGKFFTPSQEVTKVEGGASDYIRLTTTIKDGVSIDLPLLYADSNGNFSGIGQSSSERLFTSNVITATNIYNHTLGHRYFIGSWNSTNNAESYYLRFLNFENNSGNLEVDVQRYKDGDWGKGCEDKKATNECQLGSLTLTINSVDIGNNKAVNFSGNAGSSFKHLFTNAGLTIFLPYNVSAGAATTIEGSIDIGNETAAAGHNSGSFWLYFDEEDKNANIAAGNRFNITLDDNSDNEVEVSNIDTGRALFTDPSDSNYKMSRVYSELATFVEQKGQSSDQRRATITYNGGESYADLILTTKDATVTNPDGNTTTTTTTTTGVKELGDVKYSDAEAASLDKNLIIVGGSCVNSIAANLLGGALCGADFTAKTQVGAGQYLIETFARANGKVAILVAGYNAGDTTNAATYLRTKGSTSVDTSVGKKYVGTSATEASLQVAAAPTTSNTTG